MNRDMELNLILGIIVVMGVSINLLYVVLNLRRKRSAKNYLQEKLTIKNSPNPRIFTPNGLIMFELNRSMCTIEKHDLREPFDKRTAKPSVTFDVSCEDTNPKDITFNSDFTKMYMLGSSTDCIYQYTLPPNFDLFAAYYDSISFNISCETVLSQGLSLNSDDSIMQVYEKNSGMVFEYVLETPSDIYTAYYSKSFSENLIESK